jgi:hypothetical protein
MTFPSFVFALLIALLCGTLFHIFRGGGGWRLLLYNGLSVIGYSAGQWFSNRMGWGLFKFGILDVGIGVFGSLVFLMIGEWLSKIEGNKESGV